MASAWGASWGRSWGNAWGRIDSASAAQSYGGWGYFLIYTEGQRKRKPRLEPKATKSVAYRRKSYVYEYEAEQERVERELDAIEKKLIRLHIRRSLAAARERERLLVEAKRKRRRLVAIAAALLN